jgi:hypothetical protein
METIEYGGFTFKVPEHVIHRGKKYDVVISSYTFYSDVAKRWAKHTNEAGLRNEIVKPFKAKDGKRKATLYVLYKRYVEGSKRKKSWSAYDIGGF